MWVFSLKMLWKTQSDLGTPNTVAENQNRMGHINRIWSTLVCSVNVVFVHQYLFTVTVTYPFPNWSVQCTVVRIWTCFYWKALQRRHFLSLTLASPSPLREMTHFFPFRSFRRRLPDLKGTDMTTKKKLYSIYRLLIWYEEEKEEGGRRRRVEAALVWEVCGLRSSEESWPEAMWHSWQWWDFWPAVLIYLYQQTVKKKKKKEMRILLKSKN